VTAGKGASGRRALCYPDRMDTATAARPSRDPVAEALDRAPIGAPFPPEVRAALDAMTADLAAGRLALVPNDDVPAWLEEQARLEQAR
jgi:hypothetical protein